MDIGAGYTARGEEVFDSAACVALTDGGAATPNPCFKVDANGSTADGNITAEGHSANLDTWCTEAKTVSGNQGLTEAAGAIKTYSFGASNVI